MGAAELSPEKQPAAPAKRRVTGGGDAMGKKERDALFKGRAKRKKSAGVAKGGRVQGKMWGRQGGGWGGLVGFCVGGGGRGLKRKTTG